MNLFYTQGDYGLLQCARNCFGETYGNERQVREMVGRQKDQRVPSELVPRCPHCGAPMVPNLRVGGTFCEDRGWHEAASRYRAFCEAHSGDRVLYLELGVGDNTPVIIKYRLFGGFCGRDSGIGPAQRAKTTIWN